MPGVDDIRLRIIFNSFGNETIEAVINNSFSASCPGGISTGSFEAGSLGAAESIKNFSKIKGRFIGDFDQQGFDALLNENMKALGSTLTTALSLAFFSACFDASKCSRFPHVLGNIIGGGAHSFGRRPEIQEILTIPDEKSVFGCIKTNFMIWKDVMEELKKRKTLMGLNPESAWVADMPNENALELVRRVADKYGARMGIDFAASSVFSKGCYIYGKKRLSRGEQIDYNVEIAKKYNLYYIEDPMEENDIEGFGEIMKKLPKSLVCGDDLIASHVSRLNASKDSINALIVKPNQVGTVSECMELFRISEKNRIAAVVSHRSKETCCAATARLSLYARFAKFGVAGIRTSKLNELIRLWDMSEKPKMNVL